MIKLAIVLSSLTVATAAWAQPDGSQPAPPDPPPPVDPVVAPDPPPDPPEPVEDPFAGQNNANDNTNTNANTNDGATHQNGDNDGRHTKSMRGDGDHENMDHEGRNMRPIGFTVGFGFGYDLPADISIPDTTSIRIRLPNGITFEPALQFSRGTSKNELGPAETTNDSNVIAIATSVRVPIMKTRRMDFLVVGGAGVSSATDDPDGGNNSNTLTVATLFYGISVNLWHTRRWALSMTTSNPLFTYSRLSQDDPVAESIQTDTEFGLVFDPDLVIMLHLFFN